MELKEEHKLTELGSIPVDWSVLEFQDVLEGFSSGQTPYRGNPEYYIGNLPWITSGELNYNVIEDTIEKITLEGAKAANLKKIPIGTFLFAITGLEAAGTRGSCAITGIDAYTNQSCMALYPKNGILITPYLFHYYVKFGNDLALKFCQGTKQQSYTAALVRKLPIVVPLSTKEQSAIATALSDMDALIAQTEKLIEKKKAIKQGVMQRLLSPYEEDGNLKVGWVEKKLGECLLDSPKYGLNAAAVPYNQSLPVYLRITDITEEGRYSRKNIASVNNHFASLYLLEEGDLVFARTGASVGKTYLYSENDGKLVFAGFLIRVKSNPEVLLPKFLQSHTHTKKYFDWINANSMRSGQPGINANEYQEMKLWLPKSVNEQKEIMEILTGMEDETTLLGQRLKKSAALKQGMMQNLLTGKIRIYTPQHESAATI